MSLDDVIKMYMEKTRTIFPSTAKGFRKKLGIKYAVTAYSQDGLKSVIEKVFGKFTLTTACNESEPSIAAAVARRHNPPDNPTLEILTLASSAVTPWWRC